MGDSKQNYSAADEARFYTDEKHSSQRSNFARDRARILHSSGLRRLSAKTQVLSPTAGLDFARNRLTHSLEVAQVGRELASALELDPDIVDAACLAHDLGHPPFGHNGETALNDWAVEIGGFEGNAQSLRLLTRLEPKVFSSDGKSFGLNLTRAVLDASTKYPWPLETSVHDSAAGGRNKFGVYTDDLPVFAWLREGATERSICVEAQVMDLSDDIAYSVHDFEDAIFGGFMHPNDYFNLEQDYSLLNRIRHWVGDSISTDALAAAAERLSALDIWLTDWTGDRSDQAQLKNLTSVLIGRFVQSSIDATKAEYPVKNLARYRSNVVIPAFIQEEIALLKGIVAVFVMERENRQTIYQEQRELLTGILDHLNKTGEEFLEIGFQQDFHEAVTDAEKRRVFVDQVANLTDQSATRLGEQLGII